LLLEHFNSLHPDNQRQLNRHNLVISPVIKEYAGAKQEEVAQAITEAWMWLEREGLIAPRPGAERDWIFVTRRGQALRSRTDFEAFKKAGLLPAKSLDPVLAQKVKHLFTRGDYDTAVFQAFKEVEVRVRSAAGLPEGLIGVNLVRTAFHPEAGPLTDKTTVPGERQAISDLFAGAIGAFKNPPSHRNVDLTAQIAVELIYLANYLLRVVDSRRQPASSV